MCCLSGATFQSLEQHSYQSNPSNPKGLKWLGRSKAIIYMPAFANSFSGTKVIHVLEEIFGRINVTESLVVECVHRVINDTIEFLLSRAKPAQITKEVLITEVDTKSPEYAKTSAPRSRITPYLEGYRDNALRYSYEVL